MAVALGCAVSATLRAEERPQTLSGFQSAAEGGVRRWEGRAGEPLILRATADAGAEVRAELAPDAVLSNLGCADVGGTVWCEVKSILGGPRGFVAADALRPAPGPDGTVPTGPDTSKRRARKRDFDADGAAPCAQEQGQAMGTCPVAVARGGGGDATVVATFPNGFKRSLYFKNGVFVRASSTMSGVGTDIDWQVQNGTYHLRVDDQRFELPRSFVLGTTEAAG